MSTEPERWLERYRSGESAAVWSEMRDLGPRIRSQEVWRYASALATATMLKVAKNIDTVAVRLKALGYRFANLAQVHRPPTPQTAARLDAFEARHGPLPLSLRSFYDVVGTADLTQSTAQLIQWWPEDRRRTATELEIAMSRRCTLGMRH